MTSRLPTISRNSKGGTLHHRREIGFNGRLNIEWLITLGTAITDRKFPRVRVLSASRWDERNSLLSVRRYWNLLITYLRSRGLIAGAEIASVSGDVFYLQQREWISLMEVTSGEKKAGQERAFRARDRMLREIAITFWRSARARAVKCLLKNIFNSTNALLSRCTSFDINWNYSQAVSPDFNCEIFYQIFKSFSPGRAMYTYATDVRVHVGEERGCFHCCC